MRALPSLALASLLALAACKPPPTDEAGARGKLAEAPDAPSEPLPSPDTTNAIWAPSATSGRILFGNPGERPLLALDCLDEPEGAPKLRFTRFAPADPGAGAFMAVVGNFHVLRMPVDSTEIGTNRVWQGEIAADDADLEALTGRREFTLTIPGAGMLTIQPDDAPRSLIAACRGPLDDAIDEEDSAIAAPDLPASGE